MRNLGFLLFLAGFPIGGFLLSYDNNLANQPVLLQSQTWVAIVIGGGLWFGGWLLMLRAERKEWKNELHR